MGQICPLPQQDFFNIEYKLQNNLRMIPSLCWVAQGVAAEQPHVVQLEPDELKELIEKTERNLDIVDNDEDAEGDSEGEETHEMGTLEDIKEEAETEKIGDEVDDEDEFNMAEYDNEEPAGEKMFGAGLTGVTYYANPEDDPYITFPSAAREDEDFNIKLTDNLICVAKLDGEMSNIEVHLWNADTEDFYVHHDILLDKYPLSLEWMSYDAGEQDEDEGGERERQEGNYVALGSMAPQIEIWDLDLINSSEPIAMLGQRLKPSKKKPKIGKKGHSDAVMSLSWNRHNKQVLASGSADETILLWDLETCTAKQVLTHHDDKVESVAWHLAEGTTLLSGAYDQTCHVTDCRTTNSRSWKVDGDVEQV